MSDTLTNAQIDEGLWLDTEPHALTWQYAVLIAAGGVPTRQRKAAQLDAASRCAWLENHYAAAQREVQALRVRVADLELVIASANNSLYGSEGPFLNRNGSDVPDRFHLSGPIEDLKRDAKQVQALREQVQAATDQCDHILRLYSSPLVGENEAECVKRHAIYNIVEKIRGKVAR